MDSKYHFLISPCPFGCSGFGECNYEKGVCGCDAGRYGIGCEFQQCPDSYSNRGTCVNGSCVCNEGYSGKSCSIPSSNARWKLITSAPQPFASSQVAYVKEKDTAYMVGGFEYFNGLWGMMAYNFSSNKWTSFHTDGSWPSARFDHSLTYVEGKLYMFGGRSGQTYLNEMWIFDLSTNSWTPIFSQNAPIPTCCHGAAYVTCIHSIIILGGQTSNSGLSQEIYYFNIRDFTWKIVLPWGKVNPITFHSLVYDSEADRITTMCWTKNTMYTYKGYSIGSMSSLLARPKQVVPHVLLIFFMYVV